MLDVIGQDDPEERTSRWAGSLSGAVPPRVRWVGGLALVTVAAGVVLAAGPLGGGRTTSTAAPAGAGAEPPVGPYYEPRPGPLLPPVVAVRPIGGRTTSTGAGAFGEVRLEVRNGGPALNLLSVTAEVPGVAFDPVVRPHGVELDTEERVELALGWEIEDCARLRRTGRLVLRAQFGGGEQEIGLTVTHDREAGTVRQVALDRVLGACPP